MWICRPRIVLLISPYCHCYKWVTIHHQLCNDSNAAKERRIVWMGFSTFIDVCLKIVLFSLPGAGTIGCRHGYFSTILLVLNYPWCLMWRHLFVFLGCATLQYGTFCICVKESCWICNEFEKPVFVPLTVVWKCTYLKPCGAENFKFCHKTPYFHLEFINQLIRNKFWCKK